MRARLIALPMPSLRNARISAWSPMCTAAPARPTTLRPRRGCRCGRDRRGIPASVGGPAGSPSKQAKARAMTEQFSRELCRPHVDKRFRVKGGRHVLTLVQVDAASAERAKGAPRPPFTLILSGPPGDVLREGLYTLEAEAGPSFDLYVTPIHTPILGRQDYQVAIN